MNTTPNPSSISISDLVTYIDDGTYKVPKFQREFVWEIKKSAELLDSILKGYPIGTFIFWETNEKLQFIKDIGGCSLPRHSRNGSTSYILDGQQRITSLYACVKGLIINDKDYSQIFINLKAGDDETIVCTNIEELDKKKLISLTDIYNFNFNREKYNAKTQNRIIDLAKRLSNYKLSIITIKNAKIDVATDIFTRINVSGKPLSVFEIMCARIYDEKNNFDLAEKVKDLLDKWSDCDYETISTTTILQCVSICLERACKNKTILELKKQQFIDNWSSIVKSMNAAIDCFRKDFGAKVSRLLPYDALLVPFTYYFYITGNKSIDDEKLKYLKDYFWRSVFNQRFTEGVTGKLQKDIQNIIEPISNNEIPAYNESVNISVQFLKEKGFFSTGSAIVKGMLCILCCKQPLSFNNGRPITLDNAWLLQANSKNYHHFFPKQYMKNKQHTEEVNHIANITILDSETNQEIKAKAPATYIKKYENNNNFYKIMETHLIGDLEKFGVRDNDYDKFFKERLNLFNEELRHLIICKKDFDIY